jgi:ATP-binding cassette, subfamily B, bacterial PglK
MGLITNEKQEMNTKIQIYKILWNELNINKKKEFFKLQILVALSALSEVISIATIAPLLGMVLGGVDNVYIKNFEDLLNGIGISLDKSSELIFFLFCVVLILSIYLRYRQQRAITEFSFYCGAEVARKIYSGILNSPYEKINILNSSEAISTIGVKTGSIIFQYVQPLLMLSSAVFSLFMVSITIYIILPIYVWPVIFLYVVFFYSVARIIKNKIERNGSSVAHDEVESVRLIQEGVNGIRDVIINETTLKMTSQFSNTVKNLRRAQSENSVLSFSSKYLAEGLAFLLLVSGGVLAFKITKDIDMVLPVFGVLIYAAQRALPVAQSFFNSWAIIKSGKKNISDVIEMLLKYQVKNEKKSNKKMVDSFKKYQFINASYYYNNATNAVLSNINMEIKYGEKIAIIGPSGSGKTTFIDIFSTLLPVKEGDGYINDINIKYIDKKDWIRSISYVPQDVFLVDGTILDNVIFGVSKNKIDRQLLQKSIKDSCLLEYLESLPEGLEAKVGEGGSMLSGGQKQRIGIARALYKNTPIIIFDESTSALDNETESNILSTFKTTQKNKTIIMVTHKTGILHYFDRTLKLDKGVLTEVI